MIRESTRRRRRSRSVSPGRGASKRARSRSKDRRGRNTGAARDANRIVAVPRRDKRLRDERRMPRSEREMDTRHAPNSLYASGGGGSGMGGGRERDVHVRELPVKSSSYRGGGGGVGGGGMLGGRGVVVHHQPPMYAAGMDVRGGVSDHRGGGTYAGVGGGSGGMNGHARGGGYAVTLPRGRNDDRDRGDRERERERELQRERDRREREQKREREREKERKLLREREERARQREARAAADLRAAEVLRRDTARLRDEAAAHARASGGTGGARGASGNGNGTRVGLGEGGIGGGGPTNELTESGDRMPPRGRARDRGRERMTVRSQKGTYMKKDQVDALFLKVIKKMAEDKSRFPCSASLINDRMKQASVEDYNVANSEYMRFANVLARFEKDKIVGTTKSKDRLQILWTKFSPLDTSAEQDTRGAAPIDTRRNASGESRNTRVIVRGGPLKLYFCAADEIKFAGTGGEGTVTTAASPYADIIALLQARGEVMTSHDQKKRLGEAVAVPPQTAEAKTEVARAEDKPARLAAEASGESTATEYGTQSQGVGEGEGVSSSTGKGDKVRVKGKGGAELDKGEVRVSESAEEQEEEEGGIPMKEGAVVGRGGGVKGEGDEGVVAVVNSGAESSIKDPERDGKDGKEDRLTAREIFDREVAWLRSSHALVAEISTPSTSVGFKIALMTHQRFKPCLGLIRKSTDDNGKDSQSTASALSPMLRGSANLEIHEYTEPSDIDEILDEWIDRRILRKRDRDDSRRGGRRGRGDSREPPIKKEKELDGSVRGRAGRDGEDGVEENAREKLDAGGGGSNGAGVRRGAANDGDHEEDENMDDQSLVGGRDSGTGVGGEGAESLVSDDEDEDDHEEVEDATGAHDAATAVAAGVSEGAGVGLGQTGGGVDEMEVTDYGSAPEHGEVDVEVGAGAEDHEDHGEVSGGGGGGDSEKSTDEAVV